MSVLSHRGLGNAPLFERLKGLGISLQTKKMIMMNRVESCKKEFSLLFDNSKTYLKETSLFFVKDILVKKSQRAVHNESFMLTTYFSSGRLS